MGARLGRRQSGGYQTLHTQANTNRFLDAVTLLWLVEATFDQYGQSTIKKRWATEGTGRGFTKVEDEVYIYRLALVAGVRGIRVGETTYRVVE